MYNWWIVAALTGMVSSQRDLFSDLEAEGRPHAALLSRLDVVAGLLILLALVLRGSRAERGYRREWAWLLVFAAAGMVGGLFPYVCAEGVDAACRAAEWRLKLPVRHDVHILAGICEFAAATTAVGSAWHRTVVGQDRVAGAVRTVGWLLICCYPALAFAYLDDRYGAFVEPMFFILFSAMILIELVERPPTALVAPVGDRGRATAAPGRTGGP